ncbi:uncharacterized protein LOC112082786 [Eutrema salsugineum]|uniref:uncharacterized protein LOC112082786 n=1 Tax=Eutrema salsugineum TaxID=72664 RepID=UPI000CED5322|nr:uncharacterized protein LOC112082786 [Eutrema salsugineum]
MGTSAHICIYLGPSSCCYLAVEESRLDPWTWKSILKLRPLAESFLRCDVGNGRRASFWFDLWTPFGPLIRFFGEGGPSSLRIPIDAKVVDACTDTGWALPSPRSEAALTLQIHLTTTQLPSISSREDSYVWFVDCVKCRGFSSAKTWDDLDLAIRSSCGLGLFGLKELLLSWLSRCGLLSLIGCQQEFD